VWRWRFFRDFLALYCVRYVIERVEFQQSKAAGWGTMCPVETRNSAKHRCQWLVAYDTWVGCMMGGRSQAQASARKYNSDFTQWVRVVQIGIGVNQRPALFGFRGEHSHSGWWHHFSQAHLTGSVRTILPSKGGRLRKRGYPHE
jgi:hypothetical protein